MNFLNPISLFCKQYCCKEQMLKFANKGKFKESLHWFCSGQNRKLNKCRSLQAALLPTFEQNKKEKLYIARAAEELTVLAPLLMIAIMFGLFRYLMNSPWHGAPSSVVICSKELLLSLGSQWAGWRERAGRTVYTDDHRHCQTIVSSSSPLRFSAPWPGTRSYKYSAKCHVKCVMTGEWRNNNQHFMASTVYITFIFHDVFKLKINLFLYQSFPWHSCLFIVSSYFPGVGLGLVGTDWRYEFHWQRIISRIGH